MSLRKQEVESWVSESLSSSASGTDIGMGRALTQGRHLQRRGAQHEEMHPPAVKLEMEPQRWKEDWRLPKYPRGTGRWEPTGLQWCLWQQRGRGAGPWPSCLRLTYYICLEIKL